MSCQLPTPEELLAVVNEVTRQELGYTGELPTTLEELYAFTEICNVYEQPLAVVAAELRTLYTIFGQLLKIILTDVKVFVSFVGAFTAIIKSHRGRRTMASHFITGFLQQYFEDGATESLSRLVCPKPTIRTAGYNGLINALSKSIPIYGNDVAGQLQTVFHAKEVISTLLLTVFINWGVIVAIDGLRENGRLTQREVAGVLQRTGMRRIMLSALNSATSGNIMELVGSYIDIINQPMGCKQAMLNVWMKLVHAIVKVGYEFATTYRSAVPLIAPHPPREGADRNQVVGGQVNPEQQDSRFTIMQLPWPRQDQSVDSVNNDRRKNGAEERRRNAFRRLQELRR